MTETKFKEPYELIAKHWMENLEKVYDKYSNTIIKYEIDHDFFKKNKGKLDDAFKIKFDKLPILKNNKTWYITKDDDVMAERILKICELYNIVYNVDTGVYYWFDRDNMVYKYGNEILFNHFILGLFSAEGTLKPKYRNKICEYATRLGIDRWKTVVMNEAVQIGNTLYKIKDWSEIPAKKLFDYLPIYTIEQHPKQGNPQKVKKLIESWGQNYDFFTKLVAYALFQKNLLKVGFVLHSQHANSGKSKFQELIAKILEKDNCYASQLEQLCDPRQRFKTANIHNRLLVSASEFSENTLLDTGVLKAMLGGDPIEGEIKQVRGFFTVHFAGLLLISTNYIPSFKNYDYALLGRLRVIEFKNSFEPKSDVFDDIDNSEYQYVLYDAIEICKKWVQNGIDFSEVGTFTQRIEDNSNIMDPYYRFCKLHYEPNDEFDLIFLNDIKNKFLEFCEENGLEVYEKDPSKYNRKLSHTFGKLFPTYVKHKRKLDEFNRLQTPIGGIKEKISHKSHKSLNLYTLDKKNHTEYRFTDFSDSSDIKPQNNSNNPRNSDIISETQQEKKLNSLISDGSLMEIKPNIYKKVD